MKNSISIRHSARFFLIFSCLFLSGNFIFAEPNQTTDAEVRTLKNDLAKSPNNLKIKEKLAEIYNRKSQFTEVVQLLKSDSELLSRSSLLMLAKAYGETDDHPNQGRILEHLVSRNPKDYESLTLLAEFAIISKLDDEAVKYLRQALLARPNYKMALEDLLLIYQKKGNNFEMRLIYQDLIKHDGAKPEYVTKLCKIHTLDGFYDTAQKFCRAGTRIDPKNPENYLNLAFIEQSLGNSNRTNSIINTALQKFPDSDIVLASYASILIRQKNYPGAEKYFLKATQLNSENFDTQIGLANSSFESKDYEISVRAYEKACKIEPHKTARELKRAANYVRYKSLTKWEDAFAKAMEQCIPADYSSTKKKNADVSIAELRKSKPFTPFTVPLVMDIKIAADPYGLKKPDGKTIFHGTDKSNLDGDAPADPNNSGTFSSSSFAPGSSPFNKASGGGQPQSTTAPPGAAFPVAPGN